MNIQDKLTQAYKIIQDNPLLYPEWNDCKTEQERNLILAEALWDLAYEEGRLNGYSDGYDSGLADVDMA